MTLVWLKAVHISALVIWCGGLVVLPGLFALRPAVRAKPDLWRLQHFVRETYRLVISPAAFIAIGSGIGLIFLREVFTAWFAGKLAAVGLLTILHLWFGYIILHLFDDEGRFGAWRRWASVAATLGVIGAILWLVLDKPDFELATLPLWLMEPGGLRRLVQSLPEIIRPIP